MGGIGSGRRLRPEAKVTTSSYLALDVRAWQRDGVLVPGITFQTTWPINGASIGVRAAASQVILNYRHQIAGAEWSDYEYAVRLDRTTCTYGGTRAWFICPAMDCGRRVAILYLGPVGTFACRRCLKLVYASQRKDANVRAAWRAEKIRVARLGWPPGVFSLLGWQKPKGMHWRTFSWLKMEVNELTLKALTGMAQRLGIRSAPTEERTSAVGRDSTLARGAENRSTPFD
jgi:hypothetical protein